MNDFISRMYQQFGIWVLVAALAAVVGVWTLTHWAASPGKEVSVLFGLVEYTKATPEESDSAAMIDEASGEPLAGNKVENVLTFGADPLSVDRIISALQARRDYAPLSRKYVSYEIAQLVAFSARESGVKGFTVQDIYAGLDFALSPGANHYVRVNMIEIGGNLGILRRADTTVRDEIRSRIEEIHRNDWARTDPYLDELCRIKLVIFGAYDRKTLLELRDQLVQDPERRSSFYRIGVIENPDFWLPYVVGQPDLGEARFYAAYLLRDVQVRNVHELLYQIEFFLEQERRSRTADQDVIRELESAKETLLRERSSLKIR